jgi:hypothetical protein
MDHTASVVAAIDAILSGLGIGGLSVGSAPHLTNRRFALPLTKGRQSLNVFECRDILCEVKDSAGLSDWGG